MTVHGIHIYFMLTGTRRSEVGPGICAAPAFDLSATKPNQDLTSPRVFPLDDGIFSEDHLLPDHPQPVDLVNLHRKPSKSIKEY